MEVGQLTIGAKIDTQSLQESFSRLESALNNAGGRFDSINADMDRTEKSARGISLGFLSISAATAAIYGLAKSAPQLAGAMAEMQVSMMEVSFALGDALEPAFNTASEGLSEFSQWLQENEEFASNLGEVINNTLIIAIQGIEVAWGLIEALQIPEALKWIVDNFSAGQIGGTVLGAIIGGSVGGPIGAVAGAGVGFGAGTIINDIAEDKKPDYRLFGGMGTTNLFGLSSGNEAQDIIITFLSGLIKNNNKKSTSLNSADFFL